MASSYQDTWIDPDKLPPCDVRSEQAVIGSLLLAGGDRKSFAEVQGALPDPECFYQADHQTYFRVLCQMHEEGKAVDGVTVSAEMRRLSVYEECGGREYLVELLGAVPSCAHAAHYAAMSAAADRVYRA